MSLKKELKELESSDTVTSGIARSLSGDIEPDMRRLILDYISPLKLSIYRLSMKSVDTKKTKKVVELLKKAIDHFEKAKEILES